MTLSSFMLIFKLFPLEVVQSVNVANFVHYRKTRLEFFSDLYTVPPSYYADPSAKRYSHRLPENHIALKENQSTN